jgi:hypothetical protein
MVRVVSNQSDEETRRRETRDGLTWPLRELTAKLMRIANGAGKPVELMRQLRALRVLRRSSATSHFILGRRTTRSEGD